MRTETVTHLDEAIEHYTNNLGYRLDMIMPADAPRVAELSRQDKRLRLSALRNPHSEIPNPKSIGRAGMEYRDLIPDRLGGRLIASHIRIAKGGEVPDHVHYHKVRFQMIYCKSGSIRVVYEDQDLPFVLNEGDCVLQPPEIRHRVLEASAGAEVIEVSSPAEHETWIDHEMELPTERAEAKRIFSGQRFVRHIAANAEWLKDKDAQYRDIGMGDATAGLADVRVVRLARSNLTERHPQGLTFVFVLSGRLEIQTERESRHELDVGGSYVSLPGTVADFTSIDDVEFLEVSLSEI